MKVEVSYKNNYYPELFFKGIYGLYFDHRDKLSEIRCIIHVLKWRLNYEVGRRLVEMQACR